MASSRGEGCFAAVFTAVLTSLITTVLTGAVMLLEAQCIIWGLSIYHFHSGIWPVWLIGTGVEGIIVMGVAAGIRAVKDNG